MLAHRPKYYKLPRRRNSQIEKMFFKLVRSAQNRHHEDTNSQKQNTGMQPVILDLKRTLQYSEPGDYIFQQIYNFLPHYTFYISDKYM
jgi:uncharacterized protein (UPF0305 family)